VIRSWVYGVGMALGLAALVVGAGLASGWETAMFYGGLVVLILLVLAWLTRPVQVVVRRPNRHAPRSPLDGD